jgi:hypothetical protein
VIVGPAAERPAELAVGLGNRVFVDAGDAPLHQPIRVELPVLVAIGAEPVAAVVTIFIGEADGDTIARMRPNLLDQAIIEFPRPFAGQKSLDLIAAGDELGAVSPTTVSCVGKRDARRVAGVPGVLGRPRFLGCGFIGEGWQGGRLIGILL